MYNLTQIWKFILKEISGQVYKGIYKKTFTAALYTITLIGRYYNWKESK